MKDKVKILKKIMAQHHLTRRSISEILDVSIVTVDSWLAPEEATLHRNMPDRMLRLLHLELERKDSKSI